MTNRFAFATAFAMLLAGSAFAEKADTPAADETQTTADAGSETKNPGESKG